MKSDRRKYKRYQVTGLKSNISDGTSDFLVAVEDLSKEGVGLSQVPSIFDETVKKCSAEVNTPHNNFQLSLSPRWVHATENETHKKIGFEIDNPPSSWLEFVESLNVRTSKNRNKNAERIKALGLMTIIFDGKRSFIAVVEEISIKGIRLTQVPKHFNDKAQKCTAIVQSPTGDLNIALQPCWAEQTNGGMYKNIGFEIQNPSPDWQVFIKNMENKVDACLSFLPQEEIE